MAKKIDYECFTHLVVYTFLGEQIPHIEQIARMLAIERSYNLAGVQVCETDDRYFRKPELFLDARRYRPDFGFVDTTAQYRRDLDFDLHAVAADDQLGYAFFALRRARVHLCVANAVLDGSGDPFHCSIDVFE